MAKKRRSKITLESFKKACEGTWGNITAIAANLGVQRWTVYRFIETNSEAKEILKEERDKIVDIAENKFKEAVERGERWAIRLALKTLGKDRGYVERHEIEPPVVPHIFIEEVKGNGVLKEINEKEDDIRWRNEG